MRLLALPAELYPQMWESAFINFCVLYMGVLVHACTGLPAELYPHVEESEYLVFVGVLVHDCIGLPAELYPHITGNP